MDKSKHLNLTFKISNNVDWTNKVNIIIWTYVGRGTDVGNILVSMGALWGKN